MTLTRLKFATVGALAAGSTAANASIVVFDINPDANWETVWPENGGRGFAIYDLNFSNGTFNPDGYVSEFIVNTGFGRLNFFNGGYVDGLKNGTSLALLGSGDIIDATHSFGTNIGINAVDMSIGTAYIGLMRDDGASVTFGWFEVQVAAAGLQRHLTFTRFAFNTVAGQSILAGQTTAVPEASTLGFAGGLFGLVVAAHLRRRKAKQAAASDKFLALAAGESVRG